MTKFQDVWIKGAPRGFISYNILTMEDIIHCSKLQMFPSQLMFEKIMISWF